MNIKINMNKKVITIILIIFVCHFYISDALAEDYTLDFNAELIDGNKKYVDTKVAVSKERPLILHVTIINPNPFWLQINSISLNMEALQNSKNFEDITKIKSISNVLIPENEKIDYYINLDGYNSLKSDDRIGSWQIDFEEVTINEVEYYYSNNLEKIGYQTIRQIELNPSKPNQIKFEVKKEPSQLNNYFDIGRLLSDIRELDPLIQLIGLIVALGALCLGYLAYKKRPS